MYDNDNGFRAVRVDDDPTLLQTELDRIGQAGGMIVNVIWQPTRTTKVGDRSIEVQSGYMIIADFAEMDDHPSPTNGEGR